MKTVQKDLQDENSNRPCVDDARAGELSHSSTTYSFNNASNQPSESEKYLGITIPALICWSSIVIKAK